jgi:hypothetical protein
VVEFLVVALMLVLLGGMTVLGLLLRFDVVLGLGALLLAVGLLLGLPTGFLYHLRLFQALRPQGGMPRWWWLSPTRHNQRLREDARDDVLRWFRLGGLGFMLTVLGCGVILLGVLLRGV